MLGDGPAYPAMPPRISLSGVTRAPDGRFYLKVVWFVTADYQGPVLVRGRRLDGPEDLSFDDGTSGRRLRIEPTNSATGLVAPSGYRDRPSTVGVGGEGCYGLQVDD